MRYNRDATWTCCPSKKKRRRGGAGAERNTPIKEVSMGIYARVNSPATTGGEGRGGFQRKIRSFVIVLCSRLTAANNEAGDNKAGTIMTARREGPITLIVIFETRIPIVMHWKIALSLSPPLAKCWRNTKGKGGRKGEVSFFLTRFACVFFSNLIFRPSDIQPRRSFHGYIDREWIKYFFLMIHGHEDVSTKSN